MPPHSIGGGALPHLRPMLVHFAPMGFADNRLGSLPNSENAKVPVGRGLEVENFFALFGVFLRADLKLGIVSSSHYPLERAPFIARVASASYSLGPSGAGTDATILGQN
jgi:hypothetical protein